MGSPKDPDDVGGLARLEGAGQLGDTESGGGVNGGGGEDLVRVHPAGREPVETVDVPTVGHPVDAGVGPGDDPHPRFSHPGDPVEESGGEGRRVWLGERIPPAVHRRAHRHPATDHLRQHLLVDGGPVGGDPRAMLDRVDPGVDGVADPGSAMGVGGDGPPEPVRLGDGGGDLVGGELGMPGCRPTGHEPARCHHLDDVRPRSHVNVGRLADLIDPVRLAAHEPAVTARRRDGAGGNEEPGSRHVARRDRLLHVDVEEIAGAELPGRRHPGIEEFTGGGSHAEKELGIVPGLHVGDGGVGAVEPEVDVGVDEPGEEGPGNLDVLGVGAGRILGLPPGTDEGDELTVDDDASVVDPLPARVDEYVRGGEKEAHGNPRVTRRLGAWRVRRER